MKLSELKNNEKGIITKVKGRGGFRKRIMEMGFVKGKEVEVVRNAPLKDPIEYKIMGYEISLRRSEACLIEIITKEEAKEIISDDFHGVIDEKILKKTAREKSKVINVALVGNPNCGKTTLFNMASKSREHVGNYSGVTIDAKKSVIKHNGYKINIVDLPGTYSLSAYSPEEIFVRKHILAENPDLVINVVDSSNLERNLFLTTQLIDMDIKVVSALNMYDELQLNGDKFDYNALGEMIGVPFVPTVASKNKGINELLTKVIDVFEDKDETLRHIHINYKILENSIKKIQNKLKTKENYNLLDKISSRFLAIKLLENDRSANHTISKFKNYNEIQDIIKAEQKKLKSAYNDDSETLITDARYGFIAGALKETFKEGKEKKHQKTKIVDTFITHKLFGFPIFILFIFIMFYSTFKLGEYPMEWITSLVDYTGGILNNIMPDGILKDLVIDGILGGVGGVVVFLPNILLLFFFISLMEDTGYMSRAAFIMDKLMHFIGLHGKSFIPLIMGFGCNVPAIMSTRIIENRNERLLTILINPFMSCSARLPVYVLIISAFFPKNPGIMLFSMYLIGIVLAILVALVFKKIFFKTKETPFVMELPPYRVPTLRTTILHMWNKGWQYLKKVGGIILAASIIVWALGYFPRDVEYNNDYSEQIENIKQNVSEKEELNKNQLERIQEIEKQQKIEHLEKSYIGRLGKFVQPVMAPLGFDWKATVSILSGVAAKEIVISTLGVLYQSDYDSPTGSQTLIDKLKEQEFHTGEKKGQKVYTKLTAFVFMLFILIYFPCIGVIATIKKETGSWKWAIFTIFYTTGLAWILSFLVNKIGLFLM